MMIAVDIGNTSIKFGLFVGDGIIKSGLETHPLLPVHGYRDVVRALISDASRQGEPSGDQVGSAVCSVVGGHTEAVCEGIREATGRRPIVVGPDCSGGLGLDLREPERLGPDRIAAAVAAAELCGTPVVVVDFGTATTLNFVGDGPVFKGGAILPGLGMMAKALSNGTAGIGPVDLRAQSASTDENTALGKDTEGNVLSGIIYGTAGAVSYIIESVERSEGSVYKVALTGGSMDYVTPLLSRADLSDPDLTLKGLKIIYERQKCTS